MCPTQYLFTVTGEGNNTDLTGTNLFLRADVHSFADQSICNA